MDPNAGNPFQAEVLTALLDILVNGIGSSLSFIFSLISTLLSSLLFQNGLNSNLFGS